MLRATPHLDITSVYKQDQQQDAALTSTARHRHGRQWPSALGAVLGTALLLSACGKGAHGAEGGGGGFPPPEVTTLDVAPADIPVAYEYVGQTAGSREVEVRARVTGIIEKRLYQEGTRVARDQLLFKLDSATYAAQVATAEANVATAEAKLKQADRDASRLKPLIEARAISQKEYDDASSGLDLARAALKSAQAQLRAAKIDLDHTDIRAPLSGVIGRALKEEGALVNAPGDSLLATLAQTDPIHVDFGVSEADSLRFKQETSAGSLKLPEGGFVVHVKTSDGKDLGKQGKLDFTDYKADPTTGSYLTRAVFANGDGALSPGQFVHVELGGAVRPGAIAIPQRAVLDGPTGKYVYVLGKGKDGGPIAEPRPIVPGEWVSLDGKVKNAWVVQKGLKAGDQVIVDGVAKIFMPGSPVKLASAAKPGQAAAAPAQADAKPQTDAKK